MADNEKDIKTKAIERLLARRAKLQEALDDVATQPASYSITGSVSVTNRSADDIQKQITAIDLQIKRLITNEPNGISLAYPVYRRVF